MSESSNVQPLPEDAASAPVQDAAERTSHSAAEQKPGSGLAIASLVCGILGVLTGIFIFSGLSLGLAGIVLGIVALVKVKNGTASGKGMAIGGIVTGALGMIVAVVVLILGMIGIGMLSECAEHAVQDSNGNYVCTVNGHTQTLDPDEYRTLRR